MITKKYMTAHHSGDIIFSENILLVIPVFHLHTNDLSRKIIVKINCKQIVNTYIKPANNEVRK